MKQNTKLKAEEGRVMTFILENARNAAKSHGGCMHCGGTFLASYLEEACDEIERLYKELSLAKDLIDETKHR